MTFKTVIGWFEQEMNNHNAEAAQYWLNFARQNWPHDFAFWQTSHLEP